MMDEEPSDDLVQAVENRILLAQEQEEAIDLEKIIEDREHKLRLRELDMHSGIAGSGSN